LLRIIKGKDYFVITSEDLKRDQIRCNFMLISNDQVCRLSITMTDGWNVNGNARIGIYAIIT
jgi:hypothetical protein